MTTPKPSPIPWEVVPHPIDKLGMILDKSGSRLIGYAHATENISKEESHANLEIIVRAVNSHKPMLDALEAVVAWFDNIPWGSPLKPTSLNIAPVKDAIRKAQRGTE